MRRNLARASRGAMAVVCALALTGCFSWTQRGAGPGKTWSNPSEQKVTAATVGQLQQIWARPEYAAAAVASWRGALVLSRSNATGGETARLDPETGAVVWSTPGGVGHFAISDGTALYGYFSYSGGCYRGQCTNESTSGIVGLSVKTGAEVPAVTQRWPDNAMTGPNAGSLVVGDRYHAWSMSNAYLEPLGGWHVGGFRIVVRDSETGSELSLGGYDQYAQFDFVLDEASSRIYYTVRYWPDGGPEVQKIAAVDLATGAEVWSVTTEQGGSLSLEGDVLYHVGDDPDGSGDRVSALDAATGERLWTGAEPVGRLAMRAVRSGTVFTEATGGVAAYSDCGQDVCSPMWLATGAGSVSDIVTAGDLLYVTSWEGSTSTVRVYPLVGCGAASCDPITTLAVDGAWGSTTVVDGRLFVTTASGLYAFALPAP